jgi:hypothetical protein
VAVMVVMAVQGTLAVVVVAERSNLPTFGWAVHCCVM